MRRRQRPLWRDRLERHGIDLDASLLSNFQACRSRYSLVLSMEWRPLDSGAFILRLDLLSLETLSAIPALRCVRQRRRTAKNDHRPADVVIRRRVPGNQIADREECHQRDQQGLARHASRERSEERRADGDTQRVETHEQSGRRKIDAAKTASAMVVCQEAKADRRSVPALLLQKN